MFLIFDSYLREELFRAPSSCTQKKNIPPSAFKKNEFAIFWPNWKFQTLIFHCFPTSEGCFWNLFLTTLKKFSLSTFWLYQEKMYHPWRKHAIFEKEKIIAFFSQTDNSNVEISLFRTSQTCFSKLIFIPWEDFFMLLLVVTRKQITSCGASTHFLKKKLNFSFFHPNRDSDC